MRKSKLKFTRLDSCSDEEIIQEILNRYDHAVFAGKRKDNKDNEFRTDWDGKDWECIDLCCELIIDIKDPEDNIAIQIEDDD